MPHSQTLGQYDLDLEARKTETQLASNAHIVSAIEVYSTTATVEEQDTRSM